MPEHTKATPGAVHLTAETFDQTISTPGVPVLVDFWADWCPPCRALGPTIERLATELEGQAVIAKLNVDEAGEIAQRYGISSIPTMIVFRDGKPAERLVGAAPADAIKAQLKL